jgi:hypothetical protein
LADVCDKHSQVRDNPVFFDEYALDVDQVTFPDQTVSIKSKEGASRLYPTWDNPSDATLAQSVVSTYLFYQFILIPLSLSIVGHAITTFGRDGKKPRQFAAPCYVWVSAWTEFKPCRSIDSNTTQQPGSNAYTHCSWKDPVKEDNHVSSVAPGFTFP